MFQPWLQPLVATDYLTSTDQVSSLGVLSDPVLAQAVANYQTDPTAEKPPKTSDDDA